MDLSVKLFGLNFDFPLLPASGPLGDNLENLFFFNDSSIGGVVTKTISVKEAKILQPSIIVENESTVYNCQSWSEHSLSAWRGTILPLLHEQLKKPLIASVGFSFEELSRIIPAVEPFVDLFEVPIKIDDELDIKFINRIQKMTTKPVVFKMNLNTYDYISKIEKLVQMGVDGIVVTNSIGSGIAINLDNSSVYLGNSVGKSHISGANIKPIALERIWNIKNAFPDLAIIASGGVTCSKDVLEFILAGADLVQLASYALVHGKQVIAEINENLASEMSRYGYSSIYELRHTSMKLENDRFIGFPYIDDNKCVLCDLCVQVCPKNALENNMGIKINKNQCNKCGLCESRCPTKAISGILSDSSEII